MKFYKLNSNQIVNLDQVLFVEKVSSFYHWMSIGYHFGVKEENAIYESFSNYTLREARFEEVSNFLITHSDFDV